MTINHDALDFTIKGSPNPGLLLQAWPWDHCLLVTPGSQDWIPFQTFQLKTLPCADIWWLATEAYTVGKQVVHILLECFLVDMYFFTE